MALLLLCTTQIFAQTYSEVVQVEGKTSEELYVAAREWFAVTFNSANEVLQMDDPMAGKLVGKGATSVSEFYTTGKGLTAVPVSMQWDPNFTMKIEVREGRYKCTVSDVSIKSYNELIGATEVPFSRYTDQLETFKNGSDPEWVRNNPPQGMKMNKSMARATAQSNEAHYKLVVKTENKIKALMNSLEAAMKKDSEDDW